MPGVYTTKITNMLNQKIVTNYRMPKENLSATDSVKFNPVISVEIQPRALLNEVVFPNEHFYHHWKLQNEGLFKKGILVEGESLLSENQIKDKHQELVKNQSKENKNVIESQVEKIEESAANVNATLHFEEIEASDEKKSRRRRNDR